MATATSANLEHDHDFHSPHPEAERRTRWVVAITVLTMVVEIVFGLLTGSMALLADGWHMGTHAGALGIAVFAYAYARRHARSSRFAFGTGKVGVLGGYSSAVILAVAAALMIVESVRRLLDPVGIAFDEALIVAAVGLVVNLACAWILSIGHGGAASHHHDHAAHSHHDHGHPHEHHDHHAHHGHHQHGHHDHNLRAAYLHVVADALTSVLAIVALLAGRNLGWVWLDPVIGVLGGLVIARWSLQLLRDCGRILLDSSAEGIIAEIRRTIESDGRTRLVDVHVWSLGGEERAAILSVASPEPQPPEHYKSQIAHCQGLRHVTVEVHAAEA